MKSKVAEIETIQAAPFLKWAGGKRWLVNYSELFPKKYDRYIEPFLGSGAVFFHLKPSKALLSDLNRELIATYRSVKKNSAEIEKKLSLHQRKHTTAYYYKIRSSLFDDPIDKAAQFIYLNRTCWNGLYRVNVEGTFNVPIGTKSKVILDTDNWPLVSEALQKATLYARDFEKTVDAAEKGDFLFIDPPYTVKDCNDGFVKYNNQSFSWADQVRLKDAAVSAHKRGAKIMLTNIDHPSIKKLYSGVGKAVTLDRASVISGSANGRGRYSELVIRMGRF